MIETTTTYQTPDWSNETTHLGWLPVMIEGRIYAWAWKDDICAAMRLLQEPAIGRPN